MGRWTRVFTHYILQGMKGEADIDGDGIVTVGELFEYVRDKVKQETDYKQHPSIGADGFDRNLPISIANKGNISPIIEQQEIILPEQQQINYQQYSLPFNTTRRSLLKIAGFTGMGIGLSFILKKVSPFLQKSPSTLKLIDFDYSVITVDKKGKRISSKSRQAKYFLEKLGKDITLAMVLIPGGKFMLGTEEEEIQRLIEKEQSDGWEGFERESPSREETVQPFFMGKYPVTQEQWETLMGNNPSIFRDSLRNPVENVTWHKAVEFCDKLSEKTGRKYRLPSEAEWEYACRARTTTPFYFGETITGDLANYKSTEIYANEKAIKYREKTTEVGLFNYPNLFGLYDMHGNVWEWCEDDWHENYNLRPHNDGSAWLSREGNKKVRRGGSWDNIPERCRSAFRNDFPSRRAHESIGFRVVCNAF